VASRIVRFACDSESILSSQLKTLMVVISGGVRRAARESVDQLGTIRSGSGDS
jgi:hypothetical protein